MKTRSKREFAAVAIITLLWGAIIACLVVLDKGNYGWMALIVYACVYVAIAKVESRSRKQ